MSARPDVRRLAEEDLDLLLSRSIDGDLSPEEEREVQELLAGDPRAARRLEELSALVGRLKSLPDPAPPLGLTARVNAHAVERSKGMGALWHRLGLFPPPSMVRGIVALFAIVLIGISVLKTQSERQKAEEGAASDDGRVPVFIGERPPAAPAAPARRAPEPKAVAAKPAAKSEALRRDEAPAEAKKAAGNLPSKEEGRTAVFLQEEAAGSSADALAAAGGSGAPAGSEAESQARHADAAPMRKSKLAASLQAPEAPRPAAQAAPSVAWSVRVVSSDGWILKRAPDSRPSSSVRVRLLVTLDASGHVREVRPAEGGLVSPEVEAFARGLLFERPPSASPVAGPLVVEIEVGTR